MFGWRASTWYLWSASASIAFIYQLINNQRIWQGFCNVNCIHPTAVLPPSFA